MGSPALSVRIAIGALIIKERLGTSDEETVEQIREILICNTSWASRDTEIKRHFIRPCLFTFANERDNRKFCKKLGIRLSANPALGRPPKQIDSQLKTQARQDELDRIPI